MKEDNIVIKKIHIQSVDGSVHNDPDRVNEYPQSGMGEYECQGPVCSKGGDWIISLIGDVYRH